MVIISDKFLRRWKRRSRCEWCGIQPGHHRHHIQPRGSGSGKRLDVALNLITLCFFCHDLATRNELDQLGFQTVVAKREGVSFDDLVAVIGALNAIPHRPLRFQVEAVVEGLTAGQRELIQGIPEIEEILKNGHVD
jgi:hypothetical protein